MNIGINMNKKCPRCKETKSLDDYHYSRNAYNKRQTYCKVCNNQIDKLKRDRCKANGPTIIRTHKICAKCNVDKQMEDFPISRDKPDWRLGYCKKCWTEYVKDKKKRM